MQIFKPLVSIDALYTETGWETLESRRNKHKLTLFYKMKSGMSPHYLTTLIPPIVGNTSTYNLPNANDIGMVHANSQLYYNSFLPSVIRKWNELPEDTRQSSNIASFKTHLNRERIAPPSYYCAGTRDGQIYHTRLRTSCSTLNHHLYPKNIIQSPLCACGAVENTKHFLFECQRYDEIRQEMIADVSNFCAPTVNVLLFGDASLSANINRIIFCAVQKFILKSKRFRPNYDLTDSVLSEA